MAVAISGSTGISGAPLQRGTTTASTSGTSIQFTDIPSWVSRITVMYAGVSLSGTSLPIIQLGTAPSTYTTSGYLGGAYSGGATYTNMSSGFIISNASGATDTMHGISVLSSLDGLIWAYSSQIGYSNQAAVRFAAGSITMASTIDRIRIQATNGTDTFDAGKINIIYE